MRVAVRQIVGLRHYAEVFEYSDGLVGLVSLEHQFVHIDARPRELLINAARHGRLSREHAQELRWNEELD